VHPAETDPPVHPAETDLPEKGIFQLKASVLDTKMRHFAILLIVYKQFPGRFRYFVGRTQTLIKIARGT